ncbi:D-glycerate 3-kinase plant type [Geitlerinema sp. FC II]|nr:D-glycerate 3-kinase plant type [Geitlerinema sp. FC II]
MDDRTAQLEEVLGAATRSRSLDESALAWLVDWELEDSRRSQAFGISVENAREAIARRWQLLRQIAQTRLDRLPLSSQPDAPFFATLWTLWLPLSQQLAEIRRSIDRPLVQGILGGQGTGKTTLAAALTEILDELGYAVVSLSIDDLYKTYWERQQLKVEDPRLVRRGPPGTHDVPLGIEVLDRLRRGQIPVDVPRFDKSVYGGDGDRTASERVELADIVLFEGWFVGVEPVDPTLFDNAPPPIATDEDKTFARDCNARLRDYLPLWERLDRLMVLYPVDYRLSQQWRLQAERDAIARGKDGMSDDEIFAFVEYFWNALHPDLFVEPLIGDRSRRQLVVRLNADRAIGAIFS